jgi:hypothetical protein
VDTVKNKSDFLWIIGCVNKVTARADCETEDVKSAALFPVRSNTTESKGLQTIMNQDKEIKGAE